MPVYSYQALTIERAPIKGTNACESARRARNSFREKGFSILSLDEIVSQSQNNPIVECPLEKPIDNLPSPPNPWGKETDEAEVITPGLEKLAILLQAW